jgi:WD40 repeat protein
VFPWWCASGLDGKVKMWDVFGNKKCMRTYLGHSKGVKDINFTNDGTKFVSVGYDKNTRLWDTETGQVGWLAAYVCCLGACLFRAGLWGMQHPLRCSNMISFIEVCYSGSMLAAWGIATSVLPCRDL